MNLIKPEDKQAISEKKRAYMKAYLKEYNARPERRAYQKAHRETPERKEYQRQYMKSYMKTYEKRVYREEGRRKRSTTPSARAYQKAYRENAANKERNKAYQKEYQSKPEQREKHRQRGFEYRKANPEIRSRGRHIRRANILSAIIGDTAVIFRWEKKWRKAKYVTCYWCNSRCAGNTAHADHIIPLSKGGSHSIGNLCISCQPCNSKKHAKTLDAWNNSIAQPVLL